jgi:hypothetical protein
MLYPISNHNKIVERKKINDSLTYLPPARSKAEFSTQFTTLSTPSKILDD